jgi:hypothetical protein
LTSKRRTIKHRNWTVFQSGCEFRKGKFDGFCFLKVWNFSKRTMAAETDRTDYANSAAVSTNDVRYIMLSDGSLQVCESEMTPGAPSLQRFSKNAKNNSAADMPEGGIPTRQDAGLVHDVTPAMISQGARDYTGSNMAAPTVQNETYSQSMFQLYQQQMLTTQNMCYAQQTALSELTETVKELKNSISGKRGFAQSCDDDRVGDLEPGVESSDEYEDDKDSCGDDAESMSSCTVKRRRQETENKRLDKLRQVNMQFSKQEAFSPAVHEVVATTVNKGIGATIDHKGNRLLDLVKKYDRPENCEFLQVPKVNKVLWTNKQTAKTLKDGDRLMQRSQSYLTNGMMPLVQLMNKTLSSRSSEAEELFDLALDSFNLLACTHRDFSNQRRRLLMPAISDKYKQLCNEATNISAEHLFGEETELEKTMKEIDDSRKLSNTLAQYTPQKYSGKTSSTSTFKFPKHDGSQSSFKKFKPTGHTSRPAPSATATSGNFLWKKARGQQTSYRHQQDARRGHPSHSK